MKFIYSVLLLIIVLISGCNNNNTQPVTTEIKDSIINTVIDSTLTKDAVKIIFKDLTIYLEGFGKEELTSQTDTIIISTELGTKVEGANIIIDNNLLGVLNIEQFYETSISINNEGPHCDLLAWKHYQSTPVENKKTNNNTWKIKEYSKAETELFPETTIEELKKVVAKSCMENWPKVIKDCQTLTCAPIVIGISSYYLRISNKTINKIIIIENPLGC